MIISFHEQSEEFCRRGRSSRPKKGSEVVIDTNAIEVMKPDELLLITKSDREYYVWVEDFSKVLAAFKGEK